MKRPYLFALATALLTVGCGPGTLFEGSPSIRGEIRAILPATGGSDLGFVRIEGRRADDVQYDKADVTITRTTTLSRRRAGASEPITFDSLQVGMKVEATFTGAVMESYPVRATAASLVVTE